MKYILKRSSDLGLGVVTPELLKQLEIGDAASWHAALGIDIKFPMSCALPPDIAVKEGVCSRVLLARAKHEFAKRGGLQAMGKLDLKVAGCSSFKFEGEAAAEVKHMTCIAERIHARTPADRNFTIKDNDADWNIMSEHTPNHQLLFKFFEPTDQCMQNMCIPGETQRLLKVVTRTILEKTAQEQVAGNVQSAQTETAAATLDEAGQEKKREHVKRGAVRRARRWATRSAREGRFETSADRRQLSAARMGLGMSCSAEGKVRHIPTTCFRLWRACPISKISLHLSHCMQP